MLISRTPFYIELLDATGKKATGYIGAVGAGETLGSELITGWTNGGYDTWASAGVDITSTIGLTDALRAGWQQYTSSSGWLVKLITTLAYTGNQPFFWILNHPEYTNRTEINDLVVGANTKYRTLLSAADDIAFITGAITNYSVISNSFKRVTDPPSTAVHIVSSLNGTTRNWASIESGFDPNTIATWKIYDPAHPGMYFPSDGSTFNRGDFTEGNAFFWSSIDLSLYAGTLTLEASMPTITEIEDAIISTLKSSDMGSYCKKIDSFQIEGGDLEEQIRLLSGNLPSVLIQYLESPSFDYSMSGVQDQEIIFSILVCSQSTRGAGKARRDTSIGTYKMLDDLRKTLTNNKCGLDIWPLFPENIAAEVNTKMFSAYSMRFKTRCRYTL
jgi:phage gp37-like protein